MSISLGTARNLRDAGHGWFIVRCKGGHHITVEVASCGTKLHSVCLYKKHENIIEKRSDWGTHSWPTTGSQKVPGILWYRRFGAPLVLTVWTECLPVLSTCSFRRGYSVHFGGTDTIVDRDIGFCTTTMHRATHRLLWRTSSSEKIIPVTTQTPYLAPCDFWLFLLWKWVSKRHVLQPWKTSNRMRRPNCRRF
jgi:hypothetical protein